MSEQLQVKAAVERDERGRVVKGTPNPGGQPKWVREVQGALRESAERANEILLRILNDPEATRPELLKAVEIAFSYTLPKPKQTVELEGSVTTTTTSLEAAGLTREQIVALAKKELESK